MMKFTLLFQVINKCFTFQVFLFFKIFHADIETLVKSFVMIKEDMQIMSVVKPGGRVR